MYSAYQFASASKWKDPKSNCFPLKELAPQRKSSTNENEENFLKGEKSFA